MTACPTDSKRSIASCLAAFALTCGSASATNRTVEVGAQKIPIEGFRLDRRIENEQFDVASRDRWPASSRSHDQYVGVTGREFCYRLQC